MVPIGRFTLFEHALIALTVAAGPRLVVAVKHLVPRSEVKALTLEFCFVDCKAYAEVILCWHLCVYLIELLPELGEISLLTLLTWCLEV